MSMLTAKPEQLGTYSGEQLFEISLGQYRDVVGELPPTPLRVGDAMEIGKCYATLEGCYFAPFMQDGQAFIEKIRIFELGDPDRICLKLSESQGELRVVEGQTIWEIPRGQYPGRAAWGEPVEAKKPVECSEKRPLAPGALLEVGKFYRDSSGAYMAVLRKQGPYRIVSVPQVATESGWRKVHRENLVALGPPEGHTWEISQKEYEERVARGREGFCEAPTSGEPVTCPECGDVVCGKNRLVEVQDGDEMLFVGCLPCLDRCVEGHPLLAFLAREWLAREEPK